MIEAIAGLVRRLSAALVVIALMGAAGARAADGPTGWRAGPDEDAVIEIGQRFDCKGPECPVDLSCLYALGPPRPPGSWHIDTEFMLDEERMPWKDVAVWFVEKAKALRPELASNPLVRSDRLTAQTAPYTADLGGEQYVLRDYQIASRAKSFDLDAYLWSKKGRLRIAFCIQPSGRRSTKTVSPAVESLLAFLRRKDASPSGG